MQRTTLLTAIVLGATGALATIAAPARADLTLSLSPALSTLLPGGTTTLTGLLTNTGTESVSLLGTGFTINGPDPLALSLDASDFENNLPFTLASSASYSGLFQVALASGAPQGEYSLTYSVDGLGDDFYHAESTATFNTSAAAPEPGTLGLLAVGALGLRRRRRSR